jgi:2-keto-3-deoxy-L-rhamnonate aldolase RhmA
VKLSDSAHIKGFGSVFAGRMGLVLDCANGHQKEHQEVEEVDEIEENRRKENESGKEAGIYQEISEEGGCSKQSQTEKAGPEASSRKQNCESG